MSDPTEYEPNSRDITDDPNFLAPRCGVCGVPWANHMGIMGVCLWNKALKEDLKASLEAHDEMRLEIAQLRKERAAALAVIDEFIIDTTTNNETPIHECEFRYDPEKGKCDKCQAWGNYVGLFCSSEEEETQQAMNNIAKLDEDLGL